MRPSIHHPSMMESSSHYDTFHLPSIHHGKFKTLSYLPSSIHPSTIESFMIPSIDILSASHNRLCRWYSSIGMTCNRPIMFWYIFIFSSATYLVANDKTDKRRMLQMLYKGWYGSIEMTCHCPIMFWCIFILTELHILTCQRPLMICFVSWCIFTLVPNDRPIMFWCIFILDELHILLQITKQTRRMLYKCCIKVKN